MAFDLNKYKRTENGRIDFSRSYSNVELPNLCDVQLNSFDWFQREGINEVFSDMFPVYSNKDSRGHETETDKVATLDFVSAEWGKPEHDYFQCKVSSLTYVAPLHVNLRLKKPDGSITQSKVFMGKYPWMTPSGTFIVNGSEKCIASQLVRSPGAYVNISTDVVNVKKNENDTKNEVTVSYSAVIFPLRGIWIEFLTDGRDRVAVRIDKQKKMSAITFLRALGITSDSNSLSDDTLPASKATGVASNSATGIFGLFGENNEDLNAAVTKNGVNTSKSDIERQNEAVVYIFKKLRPSEPCTNESAAAMLRQRFFENEHYDLCKAGRFKINKKLGIYDRLVGQTLAEDLIDNNGEIVFESGYTLTTEDVHKLQQERFFETSENHTVTVSINHNLDDHDHVNLVRVYKPEDPSVVVNIVGNDLNCDLNHITIPDILAALSYMLNVIDGIGTTDDTDHLGNKRVRCVGELIQDKFRTGLSKMKRTIHERMSTSDLSSLQIEPLINIKALTSSVIQFFNSDSLSQFMDQTNPLAELTNKRRLSALGRGGLSRERASSAVRDVHPTHYGRICPIETPEGQNVGLISNLACYARVNSLGFLETPYRPVNNCVIDNEKDHVKWLSADEEKGHVIAQSTVKVDLTTGKIIEDLVSARKDGEYIIAKKEEVDLIDAASNQIVSIAAACIPFLENDDGKRSLMGSNMQRQALPLLEPKAPYIGTGLEAKIAHDSGEALICENDGVVTYIDSKRVDMKFDDGSEKTYQLRNFIRSNKRTAINQTPNVKAGDRVKKGDILANGPSMENGELALGQNVVVAFTTWHGYNYEDAVVVSQRCVDEDLFTNIIIEEYSVDRRKTKLGEETFTRDVPNLGEDKKTYLDERGIVMIGTEVHEGDILVGKTTPKGETTESNNEHLLKAIFASKSDDDKDTSMKVPHGADGTILDVKVFSRAKGDELPPDVLESVKVYVVQKRKIQIGDKIAGRHGNKGVISKILPIEDMPYLPDGTPVDILLSPMGVPSRMNIGQILETQLGLACKKLNIKISTPVFDGATLDDISEFMKEAKIDKDGKTVLYDGQTGERFNSRISVGVMYMIKLDHMVEDKIHARAIGPYSLVTQQPLGGKAQNGGQRFGEMEVWALEAYGAAYILQEMLTIKSDDMVGRNKTYEAILKGDNIPNSNMPEATRVLIKELQGLAIDVKLLDENNQEIDMNTISEEAERSSRNIHKAIINYDTKHEETLQMNENYNRGRFGEEVLDPVDFDLTEEEQQYEDENQVYAEESADSDEND